MKFRTAAPLVLTAVGALALAGCSNSPATPSGKIHIVASTNVYGQIAEVIGGDEVEVTSIISSASQDPHEYEASPKDKLTVSKADIVVMNGGGYDAFVDGLITDDSVPILKAVSFADDAPDELGEDHDHDHDADDHADDADVHADEADDHAHEHTDDADSGDVVEHDGHTHIAGFNEHVWYDPEIVEGLAEDIAEHLGELDPTNAKLYEARADEFAAGVDELEAQMDALEAKQDHTHILVTEPVALRLTDSMDLHNVTPAEFSEAVEEGQDVAPAVLLDTVNALTAEDVKVVIANTQTGGAETERIIQEADAAGIPVIEFSEILPDGLTYLEWMKANVEALDKALV